MNHGNPHSSYTYISHITQIAHKVGVTHRNTRSEQATISPLPLLDSPILNNIKGNQNFYSCYFLGLNANAMQCDFAKIFQ